MSNELSIWNSIFDKYPDSLVEIGHNTKPIPHYVVTIRPNGAAARVGKGTNRLGALREALGARSKPAKPRKDESPAPPTPPLVAPINEPDANADEDFYPHGDPEEGQP